LILEHDSTKIRIIPPHGWQVVREERQPDAQQHFYLLKSDALQNDYGRYPVSIHFSIRPYSHQGIPQWVSTEVSPHFSPNAARWIERVGQYDVQFISGMEYSSATERIEAHFVVGSHILSGVVLGYNPNSEIYDHQHNIMNDFKASIASSQMI